MRTRRKPEPQQRHGMLSMELVLTLPILAFLLLALLEFSLLFFARGDVVEACRAGARKATLQGATMEAVAREVQSTLSPRLRSAVQVAADLGTHAGDPVTVAVQVPMSAAAPDLLWPIGFGLRGRNLLCETRMAKE